MIGTEDFMDNWTFGGTLIVVGMGGTLATLGFFAILMGLLKRVFPASEEERATDPNARDPLRRKRNDA